MRDGAGHERPPWRAQSVIPRVSIRQAHLGTASQKRGPHRWGRSAVDVCEPDVCCLAGSVRKPITGSSVRFVTTWHYGARAVATRAPQYVVNPGCVWRGTGAGGRMRNRGYRGQMYRAGAMAANQALITATPPQSQDCVCLYVIVCRQDYCTFEELVEPVDDPHKSHSAVTPSGSDSHRDSHRHTPKLGPKLPISKYFKAKFGI